MKVLRKQEIEIETANIQVGDQIVIPLAEFGSLLRQLTNWTRVSCLYLTNMLPSRPMNCQSTNKGGFEKSDLKKWMDTVLLYDVPGGTA